MSNEEITFLDETVVDERAIRRLASNKGCTATRSNGTWSACGVDDLSDDEVWEVLQSC